jgi:hypothetical protein
MSRTTKPELEIAEPVTPLIRGTRGARVNLDGDRARAADLGIYLVRALIKRRAALAGQEDLARRLTGIGKTSSGHAAARRDPDPEICQWPLAPIKPRRRARGFHVRDRADLAAGTPRRRAPRGGAGGGL